MAWLNTEAVRLVACPRCGSTAGVVCRTPKGRRAEVHGERTRELMQQHPDVLERCTVRVHTAASLIPHRQPPAR
jgi:hypothetical protein